jgi:hypothetical protein
VTPGAGAGLVTVDLPPLAAGSYGLRYKVLAADGHVTESLLRFTVAEGAARTEPGRAADPRPAPAE